MQFRRIFLLFLVFGGTAKASVVAVDGLAPAGKAVSVNGQVSLDRKKLNPGDVIPVGGVIQTGKSSGAKILFKDKTIIDIGELSHFRVEQFRLKQLTDREAVVALELGSARLLITQKLDKNKGKFHIKTKASVLAVRGTEFVLATSQGEIYRERVVVSSGLVTDERDGGSDIRPGNQMTREWRLSGDTLRAERVSAPTFNPIPQGETRQFMETHSVQDNTFRQYTEIGEEGDSGGRFHGRGTLDTASETLNLSDTPSGLDDVDPQGGDSLTRPPGLDYLTTVGRETANGGRDAKIKVKFTP